MHPFTFGVEEEYHLVDSESLSTRSDAALVLTRLEGLGPTQAQPELLASQLEVASPVCSTISELRSALSRLRSTVSAAAALEGCRILPSGTHPFSMWEDERITPHGRYLLLKERFGDLALQQNINGCHVHVAVPDPDLAVRVMDRARVWLPTLLALGSNSPFFRGVDTQYASFRAQWFTRWPLTGIPPHLGSRAAFDALVERAVGAGLVDDATFLYFDLRPSVRFPTLEFRVSDVATSVDEAVLQAALARSLVRSLVALEEAEAPLPAFPADLAEASRWRAARFGMEGWLLDPETSRPAPAPQVVWRLLRLLKPDLEEHGEWDEVAFLTAAALTWGTGAVRQRERLAAGGSLRSVVSGTVEEAATGGLPPLSSPY